MKTILLFLLAAPLMAQSLPVAPDPQMLLALQPVPVHRHLLDRQEWTLLAVDATMRGLDAYSTRRALQQGDHEMFLPNPIAHHTAAMDAYSAGMVALNWYVARTLTRHHRPGLAHLVTLYDVGATGGFAIHNLFLQPRGKATMLPFPIGNPR